MTHVDSEVEPRRRCACCGIPSNRCPCRRCGACTTSGGEPEPCTCGNVPSGKVPSLPGAAAILALALLGTLALPDDERGGAS